MKKNKILCFILTLMLAAALSVGGGAILAVSESAYNAPPSEGATQEGEDLQVGESAIPSFVTVSSTTYITGDNTTEGYHRFTVAYSGAQQSITLPAGQYRLQVWGGSGGGNTPSTYGSGTNGNTANSTYQGYANSLGNTTWQNMTSRGGAGGYSEGKINLPATTTLYLYVGGAGVYGTGKANAVGGWNGGACGSTSSNGGGGGGTDIRIGGTTLYYRVIVAGGGGGADNGGTANRGPESEGGSDDGSGGAGGGANGEQAYVNGAYSGSAATQTGGYSFGSGQEPTTSTDTGGGGGGWYGGYATNNNNGGAGGGSGYVLTSTSARPSSYAHATNSPYNMTETKSYNGIWRGNGKIVITMYDQIPTNKAVALGNLDRKGTTTITPTQLANDADLNVAGYNEVLTFSAAKVYTNSACTTEATDYFTYVGTPSTTSVTLHPRKYFANTTFYTKVQDRCGLSVVATFTASNTSFTGLRTYSEGLKNAGTGYFGYSVKTGTNYPNIADINASTAWGAGDVYNDVAQNRLTYMITRPLEPGQSSTTAGIWNGYSSATVNVADLAYAVDTYNSALLDNVYFTTYSAPNAGTNYTVSASGAASNKWTSLTITPTLASRTGWFRIPVTIGLFEKSTGLELSSASSGRVDVDIVFRIGNTRPTLKTVSSTPVSVVLNTTTTTTRTVTISDLVTDANGNDLSFYAGADLTDTVKVPSKELYLTDKYGTVAAATNYNVGTPSANVLTNASSDTDTGFQASSIYNTAMSSSVYNEAYVSYRIDGNSIIFTTIRATRNQYAATRLNALGHFYIVVHLHDSGDPRDTGIWMPIAIQVNDTSAPVLSSLDFTFNAADLDSTGRELAPADSVVISPYYTSAFTDKGIGAESIEDAADVTKFVSRALARDDVEYSSAVGEPMSFTTFAFNDFLYVNSDFGSTSPASSYYQTYHDYIGFSSYVRAETVPLYAPASWFSRLTAEQKARAGITVVDGTNGETVRFNGMKLTALSSTKDNYVEIPLLVTDSFGNTGSTTISVRVNNRRNLIRSNVGGKAAIDTLGGIAELEEVTDGSGTVISRTVTYTIYNRESEAFRITPYDLIYDADLAVQPTINNDNRAFNNSNPVYASNAAYANTIYANNNNVYMRSDLTATATKGKLGHDTLSFVESSLPFTLSGGTYAQNRYTNELHMTYTSGGRKADGTGGSMDCIRIAPLKRNDGNNAYRFDAVRVIDENGYETEFNIAVRVVNSLPYLKLNLPETFYLTANYEGENLNSSQVSGGDRFNGNTYETEFGQVGASANGFNVREFHVRELVTDHDATDRSSLSIISEPRLGYKDPVSGKFVEAPEYSKYVTVEYNVLGSGQRSGQTVFRLTALSSTQALENGLFVELEVTDGFNSDDNTSYLSFQVEVLNSAPVFVGDTQFDRSEDETDKVRYWDAQPANRNDVVSPRYIVPDEETARLLTTTGIVGLRGGETPEKTAADKVKYFAFDYDSCQRIMPYAKNAALLPIAARVNNDGSFVDSDVDPSSVAVTFRNPYGTDITDLDDINGVVEIVWFICGDSGVWHLIEPSDTTLAPYGYTLAEALENDVMRWAVKVEPVTNFSEDGLTLTVSYRDSSCEGGHTQDYTDDDGVPAIRPVPYRGRRGAYNPANKIVTNASVTFNIKIGTLGIVKNLVAYADPNDPEKDNRYFAYYEKKDGETVLENIPVYPAEVFKYLPIDLEDENTVAQIPLSYLAIPNLIADDMGSTVDFGRSYYFDKVGSTSDSVAKQSNMAEHMTLFDPATGLSWTGESLKDNPYLEIKYTDNISDNTYVNEHLYYSGASDAQRLIERVRTTPLREDLFGFTLKKKDVRSNGYLELTISLAEFRYASDSDKSLMNATAAKESDSDTTVRLLISVPNENLRLIDGIVTDMSAANPDNDVELSTAALNNMRFALGSQDVTVSLVNDTAAKTLLGANNRIFSYYDIRDYAVGATRTFKETAYFLSGSINGSGLGEAELSRLFAEDASGYVYGDGVTDAMLMAYFGIDNASSFESLKNNIKNGTVGLSALAEGINPGYTNFFTVSPMLRDDYSLSFHPVRRISLNREAAFAWYNEENENTANFTPVSEASTNAEKKTALESYIKRTIPGRSNPLRGLAVDDALKVYYPFRVIVYDDYLGTGFMNGSYQILEIRVYIENALPYINIAMVNNVGSEIAPEYEYNLDIAKGESYVLNISDFFGDNDMLMSSDYVYMTAEEIADLADDALALNTADAYLINANGANSLALVDASDNYADVAIDFLGRYNITARYGTGDSDFVTANSVRYENSTLGKIRFTAINRTRNNRKVTFKLSFSDNNGTAVQVRFNITVSNQAPVTLMNNGSSFISSTNITLRTGQYFTLLPTSWDKYVSGMYDDDIGLTAAEQSQLNANYFTSLYATHPDGGFMDNSVRANTIRTNIAEKYGIGNNIDYRNFARRELKSENDRNAFGHFSFSDMTHTFLNSNRIVGNSAASVTDVGYLALCDDDLPWGLKFRRVTPFSVTTSALESIYLNTLPGDGYAMALQVRAVSSCSNVPLTVTVVDAEGKSKQFTFRITVINSNPQLKENGKTTDAVVWEQYSAAYGVTMTYGQSLTLNVSDLVDDLDADDKNKLSVVRAFNGSAFSIDGRDGVSANDYISVDNGTSYVTIHCNNVFLGSASVSVLRFYVTDPTGSSPCLVTVNVRTQYSAIGDATATAKFTVKSLTDFAASASAPALLPLVGGADATDRVRDGDFGAAETYNASLYALFDIDEKGAVVPVEKNRALAQSSEQYLLMQYTADGGILSITRNDAATVKLALLNKYFTIDFSADGMTARLVPVGATIDKSFPIYFAMEKIVVNKQPDYNVQAGVSAIVTVDDSAPIATKETVTNDNAFTAVSTSPVAPAREYLTVRGGAGYSQSYQLWNKARNDFGLFTDLDADDAITYVGAAVVDRTDKDGNVIKTQDGWQAAGGLKCAYDISVENGVLTAKIIRKVLNTDNPALEFVLPVEITVADRSGKTSTTVITFEIFNAAPEFTEYEDKQFSVVYDALAGEYLLTASIKTGDALKIDVSKFLSDTDLAAGGESYSIWRDTVNETMSIHDLDYSRNADLSAVHYTGTSVDPEMFGIRLANKNNLDFEVTALSYNRGGTADVLMTLQDSSLEATPVRLRLEFTVANSAPVRKVDANTTLTVLGGDDSEALSSAETVVNITDYVTDPNPMDNGGDRYPTSLTYLRVYAFVMGDITTIDGDFTASQATNLFSVREAASDNPHNQKLIITPTAGKYGSQKVTVYVADDGGVYADGWEQTRFTLTIEVARDPNTVSLKNHSLPYMNEMEIDVNSIVPAEYALGYKLVELRQSSDIEYPENSVTVRDGDESGKYVIKAERNGVTVKMLATIEVGGERTDLPFFVEVLKNYAPVLHMNENGGPINDYTYENADFTHDTVKEIVPEDWFTDPEGDYMRFVSASSSHGFIVDASIDAESNKLMLDFKASGSSEITVTIIDATGQEYTHKFTVNNTTLPELNFFLGIVQRVALNPVMYISLLIGLIILILFIIFLAGVRRRRKREQEEVEALLASEMQLEEQMKRIAAIGTPPDSYMLSNGQQYNMGLLGLNSSAGIHTAELPQGGATQLPPGIEGKDDGFDDSAF